MTARDASEDGPTYSVHQTERAELERDDIVFQLKRIVGPEYAGKWLTGYEEAVRRLTLFPGPLSHAIDEEASAAFGREVRRLLYRGPDGRSKAAYRVYFTVVPAGLEEAGTTILILRVLHGARPLVPPTDEEGS